MEQCCFSEDEEEFSPWDDEGNKREDVRQAWNCLMDKIQGAIPFGRPLRFSVLVPQICDADELLHQALQCSPSTQRVAWCRKTLPKPDTKSEESLKHYFNALINIRLVI
ncbi:hypothetical protein UPYG_G00023050 [Umbra pygmaea]|uniref:Uncharacterized protein n=1 Tax=Umbra pygmaea TaxID=75934 RepID=A0ABD0Y228_UMBPY